MARECNGYKHKFIETSLVSCDVGCLSQLGQAQAHLLNGVRHLVGGTGSVCSISEILSVIY